MSNINFAGMPELYRGALSERTTGRRRRYEVTLRHKRIVTGMWYELRVGDDLKVYSINQVERLGYMFRFVISGSSYILALDPDGEYRLYKNIDRL